jgi:hypothetical protein
MQGYVILLIVLLAVICLSELLDWIVITAGVSALIVRAFKKRKEL